MKKYLYTQPADIRDTSVLPVLNEQMAEVVTVQRVYDIGLKRLLDSYFDYRYFLKYEVVAHGEITYRVKKLIRRGKLWYEAVHIPTKEKYIISYENWRIGVPELFITKKNSTFRMKIDKEMEGWSEFYVEEQSVARWQAIYDEEQDHFTIILELEDTAPIQDPGFYVGIAQATLFIGV